MKSPWGVASCAGLRGVWQRILTLPDAARDLTAAGEIDTMGNGR